MWQNGDVSKSQTLAKEDHVRVVLINELRVALSNVIVTTLPGKVEIGGDLSGTILVPLVKSRTVRRTVAKDGAADYLCTDTTAVAQINAAIAAVSGLGGGVVVIRAAATPYIIDGQLIPQNNVTVRGEGNGTQLKRKNGVDTIIWRVNGVDGFQIRDMQINGNKANGPVSATQQDIRVQDTNNLVIDNIYQHDAITHGIITKQNVSINTNITITNSRFENNGTAADGSGIYINYAANVLIANIQSSGHQLDGVQWKTSDHLEISNVSSHDNLRYGFFAVDGHANLAGCSAYNNGSDGIAAEPGEAGGNTSTNIVNADIYNNQLNGIRLADSSYHTGSNLRVWNNGQGGSTAAGLKLIAQSTKTVSGVVYTNCLFYDDQGSPTQDFGIWGAGAGTVDGNTLTDIQISGNSSTPVRQDTWGSNNTLDNVQGANPKLLSQLGNLSGTKQLDRANGNYITLVAVGSLSLSFANGKQRGDIVGVQLAQDATGGRAIVWTGTNIDFAGQGFVQSFAASAVDKYYFAWDGGKWREFARSLGGAAYVGQTINHALTDASATSLLSCAIANGSTIGGSIRYTVQVTDGTDYQVESGTVTFSSYNKGGTVSGTVTEAGSQQNASSGTLTTTWAISNANPAVISLNADTSLTPSAGYPRITFSYENHGQQAITMV